MTRSNRCAKNVLVSYMYKYVPLCSLHGHGARRLFFWNFQGGDSCTFSQGFRRFSENLRWPSQDEMRRTKGTRPQEVCGKLWALTPIPISSHVNQTEYQNACRRVKLLLLQVVNEERVNNKPSWRREKKKAKRPRNTAPPEFSRGGTRYGMCTVNDVYNLASYTKTLVY